ncbi:MAG: 50S ribosomal protein L4 [Candidatus Omnitrophota bacterium]
MVQPSTTIPVYDLKGKVVENFQLDAKVFDGRVNKVLLYEAKKMYEANARKGTVSTKTRGEVSGGGVKPWRQKGTGRARVGSSRNPLWRHGGVAFGPKPRDYSYSMPKKAVKMALVSSLNARLSEQVIKAVVKMEMEERKTKAFKELLNVLKIEGKTLVVVEALSENIKRSSRNLKNVSLKEGRNINARDVLLSESVLIEKEALENLVERLK